MRVPSILVAAATCLAGYAVAQEPSPDPPAENEVSETAGEAAETAGEAAPTEDEAPVGPDDSLRVILTERVPPGWLVNDPDNYPLRPERWRRRMPRECRTQGGYRANCQGERNVAVPSPEAAARAERLGLGDPMTARWLRHKRPLDEWIASVAHLNDSRSLTFPVPEGRMGRGFGRVRRGSLARRRHDGVDIGAPEGATIVASRDGLVMYSDDGVTGYGNAVMVLHREGYSTFYAHCVRTLVAAGEYVQRGQAIAEVGETGFAWAPHLHFEWRQRGWARDPAPHFLEREQ